MFVKTASLNLILLILAYSIALSADWPTSDWPTGLFDKSSQSSDPVQDSPTLDSHRNLSPASIRTQQGPTEESQPEKDQNNSDESKSQESQPRRSQPQGTNENQKTDDSHDQLMKRFQTHGHRAIADVSCQTCHKLDQSSIPAHSPHFPDVARMVGDKKETELSYLGVHVSEVDPALRVHLGLPNQQGAQVEQVIDESPAFHCAMEKHDVILSIDGKIINGEPGLMKAVRSRPAGTKILIRYIRKAREEKCYVVLGKQKRVNRLNQTQIKGCHAKLAATTKCQECHRSN